MRLPTVITTSASLDELDERWSTRLTEPELSRIYLLGERRDSVPGYKGTMPKLLKKMTFDEFDSKRINLPTEQRQNLREAFRLAYEFAQEPEGWLIFQGTNGCGKTRLAAAIANYRMQAGEPVEFVIVSEFLDHLRSSFSPESKLTYDELFESVKKAPLLILDDFGEHSSTPWAEEKLYQLINYRYNGRLPTVITTCSNLEDIETRISSRMADVKLSTAFWIEAPDYRADRPLSVKPRTPPRRGRRG